MSPENNEVNKNIDGNLIGQWQEKIRVADRNNIFCHCRNCGYEWVDSDLKPICKSCGSKDIESISCWQFPDG